MIENANGNRPPPSSYQAGVTLIELLVVMVVLAVFVAIALPSFQSMFERNRLAGAAQTLHADLQFARAESIKRNREIYVVFDSANWCYGVNEASAATCDCTAVASVAGCTVDGLQYIVKSERYPGVAISSSTVVDGVAVFNPVRGTLGTGTSGTGFGGTITFQNAVGKEVEVVMHKLGRVRLCAKGGNFAGLQSC